MADPRGINPPIEAGMMSPEEKKKLVDAACPVGGGGTISNRSITGELGGAAVGAVAGGAAGFVAAGPGGAFLVGSVGAGTGLFIGMAGGAIEGTVAALRGVKEQSKYCVKGESQRIDKMEANSLKLQQMRRGLPTP